MATAIVLLSLWPIRMLADAVGLRADHSHRLELELDAQGSVAAVLASLEAVGGDVASARVTEEDEIRRLELVLVQRDADLGRLIDAAAALPNVRSAAIAS